MPITPELLRRYAIARSLFAPTTLPLALRRLGFVQADPLRAPARAQDLTLRHRVAGYVAGDLERRYPELGIEEDFFVNYGFLGREHHALMHPRVARHRWSKARRDKADAVLAFVRERGTVHPREVDAQFNHGKVTNWFGGSSNASTELLDGMHYRGLLRVARRDGGTRVYAARKPWPVLADKAQVSARMDAMVDLIVAKYAPLPTATMHELVNRLRLAAPQWAADRARALAHAKRRLGHAHVDGTDWYWPAGEDPASAPDAQDRAWLLAPFDPLVWD
ncbi:MAG TPA: crosslink repair DNA glycosylase YcaQ family protein, partial [Burkholderiaceae bacterium]|nr:crosslink repair DNA glycosylase YcaQ family protein [Burkholderiaceae bacterium]